MTDEELKAVEERCAKATPGGGGSMYEVTAQAVIREDVPKLVAEVRRLREYMSLFEAAGLFIVEWPDAQTGKLRRSVKQRTPED